MDNIIIKDETSPTGYIQKSPIDVIAKVAELLNIISMANGIIDLQTTRKNDAQVQLDAIYTQVPELQNN